MSDNYYSKTFAGTDPDALERKRPGDHGKVEVSYNYEHTSENNEIYIEIDHSYGDRAWVCLDAEQAALMLDHLNTLLGRPLTYAPSAG